MRISVTVLLFRRRMNARIAELEDMAEQARARAGKLEKEKNKLSIEIREITIELETVSYYSQGYMSRPIIYL